MTIRETNYTAKEILLLVDDAELVTIVQEIYLCIWHGGGVVDIYDLTDCDRGADFQVLPMFSPRTLLAAHEAIDEYFENLDDDKPKKDLTKPLLGVIVETESDEPTEVN